MKIQVDIHKLNDAIEAAFQLGKVYAADEMASTGTKTPPIIAGAPLREWDAWIENHGGIALHSGDAKREIMTELVMAGELGDAFQFD